MTFRLLKRIGEEWFVHNEYKDLSVVREDIEKNICKIRRVEKRKNEWWITDVANETNLLEYKVYFYEVAR